jgi:hypothetical protein
MGTSANPTPPAPLARADKLEATWESDPVYLAFASARDAPTPKALSAEAQLEAREKREREEEAAMLKELLVEEERKAKRRQLKLQKGRRSKNAAAAAAPTEPPSEELLQKLARRVRSSELLLSFLSLVFFFSLSHTL